MIRLQTLLIILGLLTFAGIAAGADRPIDSGDQVSVSVVGEPEQTRSYAVDVEGNITPPLVGKLKVKGLFPAQVRDELTTRLSKYVRNPQVTVELLARAQIGVGVTGMVGKPGAQQLEKGKRLLDALALAEGYTADADPTQVRLQRAGEKEARLLDLSKLDKDTALNLELQDGDSIFVPRLPMNVVRVLGAVNKPGEFARKDSLTLLEAVLAAGGLTADAAGRNVQILRKNESQPVNVNLDEVLAGKAQNLRLDDGDVVTIPANAKVLVKVFGHVTKPGEGQLREGSSVLDAITQSGGFAMDADKTSVLLTASDGTVRKLNLDKVDSADGSVVLQPGSHVYVPQAALRRYAVAGGVNEPGLFPFPTDPNQKVYLTDALASAKGTVDRAKKKTIALVRKNPNGGQPIIETIDLEALLKKRDPKLNPEILVNDVVYVDVEKEADQRKPRLLDRVLGIAGAFFGGF